MSTISDIRITPADLCLLEKALHGPAALANLAVRRAIREKLGNARVVFPPDLPADRVTLGARVRFRAGQLPPEERVLTDDISAYPTGSALDAVTPRGIALLGQKAGDKVMVPGSAGPEILHILELPYHPGAGKGRSAQQARRPVGAPFYDDDPGPSAA